MGVEMLSLKEFRASVNPPKPQSDRVSPIRRQYAAADRGRQGAFRPTLYHPAALDEK